MKFLPSALDLKIKLEEMLKASFFGNYFHRLNKTIVFLFMYVDFFLINHNVFQISYM